MSEAGIGKFFSIARERYQIILNRKAGLPRPWSADPIFQTNRFCNVFREDDKTTVWFRENIRDRLRNNPIAVLMAIVAFRWFNRIETWTTIFNCYHQEDHSYLPDLFQEWDSEYIKEILLDKGKAPWVTGAYIIKTPNGMNKLDGVLWCIDQFKSNIQGRMFDGLLKCESSMESFCDLIQVSPYLGRFMAYQICADAQHTCLLEKAPDTYTWAQPGPGSTRGIGRVFYRDVDKFKYGSEKDEKEIIKLMIELLSASKSPSYWPIDWPAWDMQTVQNQLCEHDKYNRAQEGGHMKRKF